MAHPNLFQPLKLGDVTIANRFIMAPLTRCRATLPGHIPNALMAQMYSQRATAGLLIAEATMVQKGHCGFRAEPGVYSAEQVEGWKLTTQAVHAKGGKIFLQLWHGGRATHSVNDGEQPISSTTQGIVQHQLGGEFNSTGKKIPYEAPRALKDDEIPGIIEIFVHAARNAIAAGFDGVEVHGANGYLLDQFWRDTPNTRQGPYGGSAENRSRLTFEVVSAVAQAVGAGRTGVRISPLNSYNDMKDSNPEQIVRTLGTKLSSIHGLAYVHLLRGDFFGIQHGDSLRWLRESYQGGNIISNAGYEFDEAEDTIKNGLASAIAFGTKFLANPDLVQRCKQGAPLTPPRPDHFYVGGATGYTDYPAMSA